MGSSNMGRFMRFFGLKNKNFTRINIVTWLWQGKLTCVVHAHVIYIKIKFEIEINNDEVLWTICENKREKKDY